MPKHITVENNETIQDMVGLQPGQSAAPSFELHPVANNAAKLALTGIDPGYMVRVTGEAGRVEQYIGGDIDDDDNWLIIGPNTFELILNKAIQVVSEDPPGDIFLAGIPVPIADGYHSMGWFKVGQRLSFAFDTEFYFTVEVNLGGGWGLTPEANGESVDPYEVYEYNYNGAMIPARAIGLYCAPTDTMGQTDPGVFVTIYSSFYEGNFIQINDPPLRGSVAVGVVIYH